MTVAITDKSGTFRPMLWLAMPVLAEESLNLLVIYTDWWLVGHYLPGVKYKAAMGLMAYMMWLVPSLFSAVAIGATALIARSVGAGDRAAASRIANQAVSLGIVFAIAVTSIVFFFSSRFVHWMQLEAEAANLAGNYLRTIALVIPLIMVEQIAAACLRGAGDTVSGFLAKSVVNVVNVFVSASLVTGWGPFPKLGWQGVAIGTAVGHGSGGLILLVLLVYGRGGLRIRWSAMRPHANDLRRLLRIGLPGGGDTLIVIGCHLIYLSIINRLGVLPAAAHGLGVQIEALAYLPGSAFYVAAATITGQSLGAGDPRRAVRGTLESLLVGGAVMSCAGLAFFFAGDWLAAFFTGDRHDPAGVVAAKLLKISAICVPSLAVLSIVTGSLRGAGDTLWPLACTLFGFFVIRIPLAMWLAWDQINLPFGWGVIAGCGFGVFGAWWAMAGDLILRSLLLLWRFWHGGWQRRSV